MLVSASRRNSLSFESRRFSGGGSSSWAAPGAGGLPGWPFSVGRRHFDADTGGLRLVLVPPAGARHSQGSGGGRGSVPPGEGGLSRVAAGVAGVGEVRAGDGELLLGTGVRLGGRVSGRPFGGH